MRLLMSVILIFGLGALKAQNRVSYSQYMHNHALFNPAYTDLSHDLGAIAFVRHQWYQFEGAPVTYHGNVWYNLNQHGFQLQLLKTKITAFKHFEAGLAYNYKMFIANNTTLAFGLKASYNSQSANYGGLTYFDGGDPALSGSIKRVGVNFGAGAFVTNDYWHAGVGGPYLFNNKLLSSTGGFDITYNHFFLTGGYKMIDEIDFMAYPTALIKIVKGAPLSASVDFNMLFQERIWASVGYRLNHTVVLSSGVILWDDFKIVYSYDLGLGGANRYGGMTHEISLGYGMSLYNNSFQKRKYLNNKGGFKRSHRRKGKKAGKVDNTVPDSELKKSKI